VKGKQENEILQSLLQEFLSKSNVSKTFWFIWEKEITGFEKWFQIEFLRFLHEHEYVVSEDIFKEDYYPYDRRKNKDRKGIKVDITFRTKCKQYYIALELKQCNELCLRILDQELSKLCKIKPSLQNCYFRKVFALIVHPFKSEDEIRCKMKIKFIDDKLEFMIPICDSKLSCTVFSRKLLNAT